MLFLIMGFMAYSLFWVALPYNGPKLWELWSIPYYYEQCFLYGFQALGCMLTARQLPQLGSGVPYLNTFFLGPVP